jgi:hypothetical protein
MEGAPPRFWHLFGKRLRQAGNRDRLVKVVDQIVNFNRGDAGWGAAPGQRGGLVQLGAIQRSQLARPSQEGGSLMRSQQGWSSRSGHARPGAEAETRVLTGTGPAENSTAFVQKFSGKIFQKIFAGIDGVTAAVSSSAPLQ